MEVVASRRPSCFKGSKLSADKGVAFILGWQPYDYTIIECAALRQGAFSLPAWSSTAARRAYSKSWRPGVSAQESVMPLACLH